MTEVQKLEQTQDSDYKLSDLEGDEDLEVVSEFIPQDPISSNSERQQQREQPTSFSSAQQHPAAKEPPLTATTAPASTTSNESPNNTSSWGGFFGKHFGSGKDKALPEGGGQKKRDWSREQEALNKFKTSAVNTFSQMGTKMGEGSAYLYEASKKRAQVTAENLKKIRIFRTPLEILCKTEATNRPCPRLMLICCASIAASGLSTQDIFKVEPAEELIIAVWNHLYNEYNAVLPPPGAEPNVLAGVIKKFLKDSNQPLLTNKLCEEWISAADNMEVSKTLIEQLPLVNKTVLELLLDCLHRISVNSAENNMSATCLAEVLVPCLIWKVPKPTEPNRRAMRTQGSFSKVLPKASGAGEKDLTMKPLPQEAGTAPTEPQMVEEEEADSLKQEKIELEGEEFEKAVKVLSFLISNHKNS